MKFSISVPDGLWLACTLARPAKGPSEIVQEALGDWIAANPDYEALLSEAGKQYFKSILVKKED